MSELVYTVVCPRVTDDNGKVAERLRQGLDDDFHAKCSTCGKPPQVRGQHRSIELRSRV